MAEILQVLTVLRCLYAPESIPWADAVSPTNTRRIGERYKFKTIEPASTSPIGPMVFATGEFEIDGSIRPIYQLIIEANAIELQVSGESDIADKIVHDLEGLLVEIDPDRRTKMVEYTRTYQTIAVARLGVPFESMFSESLLQFLEREVEPAVRVRDAEPELRLQTVAWQIAYKSESTEYQYTPKLLRIEPRLGSKLSDRVYFTQSPTEFKVHKKLLEAFEKQLGGVRAKKVKR